MLIVKKGRSILGRNFISYLQLISINHIDSTAITFHLTNDPSMFHGKVFPVQSLSGPMKLKVEKDIKDKLHERILIPCSNPIVSAPIVPVIKSNGEVRICGDYMTANRSIDPGSYHIHTFEEIIENIGHATHYSKIDFKQAYSQILLQRGPYTQPYLLHASTIWHLSMLSSVSRIYGPSITRRPRGEGLPRQHFNWRSDQSRA